ncbi:MAG: radical SAM family heme chaperone HemW [Akkermansia sp.]|nr:radical SAM family heme chaperone HemW [Akkermansia sp.]
MTQHLYIHIPFCHRICPYCAFFKHTPSDTDMRGFVRAVGEEAKLRLPQGFTPTTLYFGGGTPSMLSPTHLETLVVHLREVADLTKLQEWSFEANPATFTPAKVEQWLRLGITRISLGVQSMSSDTLRMLGREHTPEQVRQSVTILREVGMPQVNIDLMFSLPGQTPGQWQDTLERTLELEPNHISTYNLTYEEGTPFHRQYGDKMVDEETDAAMFLLTDDLLTSAGFRHYEISNYAKEGCLSLHNLACWQGKDYYGLGPGACATIGHTRYANAENTPAYIQSLLHGQLPPHESENLSEADKRTELLGLWLRTDIPLPAASLRAEDRAYIESLCLEGLATYSEEQGLLLTRKGRLLADEIVVGFM